MAGIALLDTHALLWALMQPQRLSEAARNVIEDPGEVLLVSGATAWEISIKRQLGKLSGAEGALDGFEAHLARLTATPLPISLGHAIEAGHLPLHHHDPFDRMLIAQARLEGVPIITNDAASEAYDVDSLW